MAEEKSKAVKAADHVVAKASSIVSSSKKTSVKSVIIKADPMALAEATSRVVDAWKEWKLVQEQEQTKRTAINAQRDILITRVQANRDVLVSYLKGHFETQGQALDGLFNGLDQALAANNPDLIGPILGSIVQTVKTSPLGDLLTLEKRMQENEFVFSLGDS